MTGRSSLTEGQASGGQTAVLGTAGGQTAVLGAAGGQTAVLGTAEERTVGDPWYPDSFLLTTGMQGHGDSPALDDLWTGNCSNVWDPDSNGEQVAAWPVRVPQSAAVAAAVVRLAFQEVPSCHLQP